MSCCLKCLLLDYARMLCGVYRTEQRTQNKLFGRIDDIHHHFMMSHQIIQELFR